MALTKVGKEGITGVSNASNATFLTATAAEGVTLAGTLAVTGVHTVGTNAVATSEGGAATSIISQGLAKGWIKFNGTSTIAINDSFNMTSITDNGTGDYDITIANDMGNANYSALYGGGEGAGNSGGRIPNLSTAAAGTLDVFCMNLENDAADGAVQNIGFFGDLA